MSRHADTTTEASARAATAETFRVAIAALDAGLDALPESDHRTEARRHLAAFPLCAGLAAGQELLAGVAVQ